MYIRCHPKLCRPKPPVLNEDWKSVFWFFCLFFLQPHISYQPRNSLQFVYTYYLFNLKALSPHYKSFFCFFTIHWCYKFCFVLFASGKQKIKAKAENLRKFIILTMFTRLRILQTSDILHFHPETQQNLWKDVDVVSDTLMYLWRRLFFSFHFIFLFFFFFFDSCNI